MSTITVLQCQSMKEKGEKITMLTAYDASFAQLLSEAGVDVLLVGDSLGSAIHGQRTTVAVSMDDILYHVRCVAAGNRGALLIADMPFMTYSNLTQALTNAARLMQAGAAMVKLEGGAWLLDTVAQLSERGIPVCGHLGLTPQSVHKLGGHRVQGRDAKQAQQIYEDALALQHAGASLLVLECVPAGLATEISCALTIPTIGIGAGVECDGQVLVSYDALGLSPNKLRLAKDFLAEQTGGIRAAVMAYVAQVKAKQFPAAEHSFF